MKIVLLFLQPSQTGCSKVFARLLFRVIFYRAIILEHSVGINLGSRPRRPSFGHGARIHRSSNCAGSPGYKSPKT